jgi:nucleoside-diphosphate-sugar epimerase
VIVRLPEIYGTGASEGVDRIINLARRDQRIPVVGRGDDQVCPVFVDDAIAACASSLEADQAAGKTYTLAGECLSVAQFARTCIEVFDSGSRILMIPTSMVRAISAMARVAPLPIYPDQLARLKSPKPGLSLEARADLGFRPRRLVDGLRAMRAE